MARVPARYSRVDSDYLREFVTAQWPIGEGATCTFFHSGESDGYRIDRGTSEWHLRVYRHRFSTDALLLNELKLLVELKKEGLPVSAPIPAVDGSLWQLIEAPEGFRAVTLFDFAEGKNLTRDAGPAWSVFGKELARLHLAKARPAGVRAFTLDDILHKPADHWAQRAKVAGVNHNDVLIIADRLSEPLSELWPHLPQGIVHGDAAGWNAHVDSGNALTWFDFLWTGIAPLCWDLATFRRGVGEIDENWIPCIRGYRGVRDLEPAEWEAIPLLAAVRNIYVTSLIIDECDQDLQAEASAPWFESRRKELAKLLDRSLKSLPR